MSKTDFEWEQDFAKRIGIPIQTMREMRRHGRAPQHFKIGRRVFYTSQAIQDWLQDQQQKNAS